MVNRESRIVNGEPMTRRILLASWRFGVSTLGVLAAFSVTAATQGPRVAIGGALLVVSDTLIGMRIAGVPPLPGPPVWVMATYLLGQALIVTGWPEEKVKTSTVDYATAST